LVLYDDAGRFHDVAILNDIAYLAKSINGMHIVNVSDPENPELLGHFETSGSIRDVSVSGDFAYLAAYDEGLQVVDISDPANPVEVGHYRTPRAVRGISLAGNYAFLADSENGIRVVNISNPENPEEVGFYDTRGYSWSVTSSEDGFIYVADKYELGIYRYWELGLDPRPVISADTLNFEQLEPGLTDTLTLTVRNVGQERLIVFDAIVEGEQFSTDFAHLTRIEYDSTFDISVIFTPEAPGDFEGTLTLVTNDIINDFPVVTLLGSCQNCVNENQSTILKEFNLESAYPNPFNSTITVTYSLPETSTATLKVYDLSGRLKSGVFDGMQQAGVQTVTVNADAWASGLYFVRLDTGGRVFTQKIMLIR